jgi:serine-type D-Ala-D-Ala carboxypeptidase/endopeptidase
MLARIIFCLLLAFSLNAQPTYDFAELDRILSAAAPNINGGLGLILTQNGRVIYDKTFAGFDNNRIIPIASASKWLSGAAVMAAIDAGRVQLDDRLSRHIPSFTGDKAAITLRQAFSHTAGFPPETALNAAQNPETACLINPLTTLERCVDDIARIPLAATPGAQFAYGSLSMQSAGRMIEVATNTPWARWITNQIIQPLGMQRTRITLPFLDNNPLIAGGYSSTASDYSRFTQMILNGGVYDGRRILSPESVEQLRSDQTAGARIASSPYLSLSGLAQTRYGVGGWLTPNPQQPSIEMSSQGAFGFSPWVDVSRNLTGVLAVNDQLSNVMPTYVQLRNAISRIVPISALTYSGVTNAASFLTGPLSPGEIIVLFGENLGPSQISSAPLTNNRFPTEWQGTQVLIDNQPVPIIYTSQRQVAAIVPFNVASKAGVSLEVSNQGRRTGAFTMPVSPTSPGIFNNAILNQNGTLNSESSPAPNGSILILYGTGFGTLDIQTPDGAIIPTAQRLTATVRATIGNTAAEVLYAGSAPGLVAGATQLNIQLPPGLTPGKQQLRIEAAGTPLKTPIDIFVR